MWLVAEKNSRALPRRFWLAHVHLYVGSSVMGLFSTLRMVMCIHSCRVGTQHRHCTKGTTATRDIGSTRRSKTVSRLGLLHARWIVSAVYCHSDFPRRVSLSLFTLFHMLREFLYVPNRIISTLASFPRIRHLSLPPVITETKI